jgi:hypothetical protein
LLDYWRMTREPAPQDFELIPTPTLEVTR